MSATTVSSATTISTTSTSVNPALATTTASTNGSGYMPIRDVATKLHSSLKDSSFGVIRGAVGLADTIGTKALSLVPEPVVSRVSELSNPLIDAADHQLSNAYTRLSLLTGTSTGGVNESDPALSLLMPSEWFLAVDADLSHEHATVNQSVELTNADLAPLLQTYCLAASFQFLTLVRNDNASVGAFLGALQPELDKVWNDHLVDPSKLFYAQAMAIYTKKAEMGFDNHVTARTLIEDVRFNLGEQWDLTILNSFKDIKQGSQLIYVSALHEFSDLTSKANASKTLIETYKQSFMDAMRVKVGPVWSVELSGHIEQLFDTWTSKTGTANRGVASRVYDKYQSLLLHAQLLFDRVLPPVEKEEEEKRNDSEAQSIRGLASHVAGRIQERGVVSNVTTASTNSVKETVALAQSGVKAASVAAHNVVDPVVQRVFPYVDAAKPVVNNIQQSIQTKQSAVQRQMLEAIASTKARIEALQSYLTSLTQATKDTVKSSATSAASTIHQSLPQSVQAGLTEIQMRLSAAVKYASELKNGDSNVQQQIKDLSASYAEVAKAMVNQQINHQSEKLAALAEEAKMAVSQLILYTKRQLALERGEDIDDETLNVRSNVDAAADVVAPVIENPAAPAEPAAPAAPVSIHAPVVATSAKATTKTIIQTRVIKPSA